MNLKKSKKTKRPGSDRRWTLLFIGDHGNVITLKRFKAIVLATACVLFLALGALAVFIFLNLNDVDCDDVVRRLHGVKNAIDNQWRCLEFLQ